MPRHTPPPPPRPPDATFADALGQSVLDLLGDLPQARLSASPRPSLDSQGAARRASRRAALAAGTLALPLGPLGWLTVLPELATVWRIQAQLVADIAALHGHPQPLSPEMVLACLFQHRSGRLLRHLAWQVGERSVLQTASGHALRLLAAKVGASLARRLASQGLARWLPVVGALGLGAYAYWETQQVARAALALFTREAAGLGPQGLPAKTQRPAPPR